MLPLPMNGGEFLFSILSLPSDILILMLQNLSITELAALSRTCRFLHALVSEFGWTNYLRSNSHPSFSLANTQALWVPRTRVRYDALTDRSWSRTEFVARPLSRPWTGKLQPLLAISPSRLIVAAGSNLYSYKFMVSAADGEAPPVQLEGSCSLTERHAIRRDITGLTFLADGGLDRTLYIGFQDGALERVFLTPPKNGQIPMTVERSPVDESHIHSGDFIEHLSAESTYLLSLASNGTAALTDLSTQSEPTSTPFIDLQKRSWTSHLSMRSSTPYAAFGTSSTTPLAVHSIRDEELSANPSAILYVNATHLTHSTPSSAVYGITRAPPSFPWGSSNQILVSGWYDGQVRIHDLRSSARTSTDTPVGPAPLLPVMSLCDPWSYEAIYDVSCGGGSSSHIAAGSARHSVVSFWDVRSPKAGWSVHAPGNDSSPVYTVILESSRLFGATQSRPFVYDFGPGVTHDTYPCLPETPGIDGLKRKKGSGYYVTKYHHNRATTSNMH